MHIKVREHCKVISKAVYSVLGILTEMVEKKYWEFTSGTMSPLALGDKYSTNSRPGEFRKYIACIDDLKSLQML